MIYYTISYSHPHRHFVDFQFSTKTLGKEKMQFQLPAWRPGRYELANFAQKILVDEISTVKCDVVYGENVKKQHHWFRNLGSLFNGFVARFALGKPRTLYLSSIKIFNRFVFNFEYSSLTFKYIFFFKNF